MKPKPLKVFGLWPYMLYTSPMWNNCNGWLAQNRSCWSQHARNPPPIRADNPRKHIWPHARAGTHCSRMYSQNRGLTTSKGPWDDGLNLQHKCIVKYKSNILCVDTSECHLTQNNSSCDYDLPNTATFSYWASNDSCRHRVMVINIMKTHNRPIDISTQVQMSNNRSLAT
jgi:hypothetical protein